MIRNAFWNYCFCLVLLCQKKAVKVFICIKILMKNIFKFNVYGKVVICHYILPIIWAKERNKFVVVFIRLQKVTCLNKFIIVTTIWKFNLFWNRSFIKSIFYFFKIILLSYIFNCFIREFVGRNGEILDIESQNCFLLFFCYFKTVEKLALLLLLMYSGKFKSALAEADIISRPQCDTPSN